MMMSAVMLQPCKVACSLYLLFLLSDNKLLTHHIYADDLIFTCLIAILRCGKNTTKRVDEEEVATT